MSDAADAALLKAKRLATVSIGVVAVSAALEAALLFARTAEIDRANEPVESYRLAVTGNELLDALAIAIGAASLGALAGWLAWQYRAASLLQARAVTTKRSPSWAILWWFVPAADLWMPAVTNAELWRGSQVPAARVGHAWPVWIWWVLLVGGWLAHVTGHVIRQVVLGGWAWDVQGGLPSLPPDDVVAWMSVGGAIAGAGAIALVAATPFALLVLGRISRQLADTDPIVAPTRPDV